MIKLFFIIIGLLAILCALLRFFIGHGPKLSAKNKQTDSEIALEKCPYCGDYVPQQPDFEAGQCEICAKKRGDS
ncbi:MAG: hypothetical protein CMF60_08480 [Magnetococcales bacterium]|nr:hypothetical protein [Magnetococcales bacterium]MAF32226.1 hypothetical protein [Magnetococcales bacterium]|tara:strand:+ start:7959 stop:8180 length:222 start_codon:yes stop_codon:yes gene_type:complete